MFVGIDRVYLLLSEGTVSKKFNHVKNKINHFTKNYLNPRHAQLLQFTHFLMGHIVKFVLHFQTFEVIHVSVAVEQIPFQS